MAAFTSDFSASGFSFIHPESFPDIRTGIIDRSAQSASRIIRFALAFAQLLASRSELPVSDMNFSGSARYLSNGMISFGIFIFQ
jgi:hypothetical protein